MASSVSVVEEASVPEIDIQVDLVSQFCVFCWWQKKAIVFRSPYHGTLAYCGILVLFVRTYGMIGHFGNLQ
eukprot:scaffold144215_cov19-Prasinocladus_malaysianus.AAC.1